MPDAVAEFPAASIDPIFQVYAPFTSLVYSSRFVLLQVYDFPGATGMILEYIKVHEAS